MDDKVPHTISYGHLRSRGNNLIGSHIVVVGAAWSQMLRERGTRRQREVERTGSIGLGVLERPCGKFLLVFSIERTLELGPGDLMAFVVLDLDAIVLGFGAASSALEHSADFLTKTHGDG